MKYLRRRVGEGVEIGSDWIREEQELVELGISRPYTENLRIFAEMSHILEGQRLKMVVEWEIEREGILILLTRVF
jgi:hypothetical protein